MPNGGVLPSCLSCHWADIARDAHGIPAHVYCKRHAMDIAIPSHTFCPDLTGAAYFTQQESLIGHDVYAWIEIVYGSNVAPGIPMYHQQYVVLAPIEEYRGWSEAQKVSSVRAIHEQKKKEFIEKYSSTK